MSLRRQASQPRAGGFSPPDSTTWVGLLYLKRNRQTLDEFFVVNLLGPVALWIHREKPGGLVEQRELERELAKILCESYKYAPGEARDLAHDFLQLVEEQTGLLQARGKELYGFLHLTLEEYLAARALLDQRADEPKVLQSYVTKNGWNEVIRLCVALIREPRAVQRALAEVLTTPTSPAERGLPVVRAGECLLDVGRHQTPNQRHLVLTALLTTIRDPQTPIATRVEAGHVLGRLGDPRLLDPHIGRAAGSEEAYATLEDYWCQIEPGPFWFGDERVESSEKGQPHHFDPAKLREAHLLHCFKLARYPVTNAEFAAFLAANGPDGYDPTKPWWTDEGRTFLAPGGHQWDDQAVFVKWPRRWDNPQYNSPAQPVFGVSWYEAAAYCRWLTGVGHEYGWVPQDEAIRLPTSLEWECAARPGPDQREHPYPWGSNPPTAERANSKAVGVHIPSPVGCFTAGRAVCGAEDLVGKVWEWLATATEDEQNLMAFELREDFTFDERVLLSFTCFYDDLDQIYCGTRIRGETCQVRATDAFAPTRLLPCAHLTGLAGGGWLHHAQPTDANKAVATAMRTPLAGD